MSAIAEETVAAPPRRRLRLALWLLTRSFSSMLGLFLVTAIDGEILRDGGVPRVRNSRPCRGVAPEKMAAASGKLEGLEVPHEM